MANTTDGIAEQEWDRVREICVQIAEAVESGDELLGSEMKEALHVHLERLETKYGERSSI